MTDHELSNLLREWKRTLAPPSLDERVFGSRRLPPAPPHSGWWGRIPGSFVGMSGVLAGGLVVWGLLGLLPTRSIHSAATPEPVTSTLPLAPPVAEQESAKQLGPSQAPKPAKKAPKAKSVASPEHLKTEAPRLVTGQVPLYPADLPPLITPITVKLRVRIGTDGRVTESEVIDGDPLLNSLAIEAVNEWLFQPGLSNGEPTEAFTEVDVVFGGKKVK